MEPSHCDRALPNQAIRRVAPRFFGVYLALAFFPAPLNMVERVPGVSSLLGLYDWPWFQLVPWVGKHVLGLPEVPITGGGDTIFGYVQVLCYALLAALVTFAWFLIETRCAAAAKLRHERTLHGLLRIYLRYNLAFIMFGYGMAKVLKSQFPFPTTERLLQTYGESSPMGLLWTFMGYSRGYNLFGGGLEVLGGLLLLFRRTTTLGALVLIGVLSNVVMLNLGYDVPVKKYSLQLLLAAVFLLVPDLPRVLDLLVKNRPTAALVLRRPCPSQWHERARRALKLGFILGALLLTTKQAHDSLKRHDESALWPALYGLYEVAELTQSGVVRPLLVTERTLFRTVNFARGRGVSIVSFRQMDDTRQRFRAAEDRATQTLTLASLTDANDKSRLTYTRTDATHLTLRGTLQNVPLILRLHRVSEPQFLLVNRGFHWVNDGPLNR